MAEDDFKRRITEEYDSEKDPTGAIGHALADLIMQRNQKVKAKQERKAEYEKDLPPLSEETKLYVQSSGFIRDVEKTGINLEDLAADYNEKDRLLKLHYQTDTRNLTRVQVGRILKQNYDSAQRIINPVDDEVPF